MKRSFILKSLIAFCTFSILNQQTVAQDTIFTHLATCSGTVTSDGGPIQQLDFFEERDAQSGISTDQGYFIQTSESPFDEFPHFKIMGKIKVSGDEKEKAISMFAALEPSILFSTFSLNLEKETKVEIFAEGFGEVWGVFSCVPGFIQTIPEE